LKFIYVVARSLTHRQEKRPHWLKKPSIPRFFLMITQLLKQQKQPIKAAFACLYHHNDYHLWLTCLTNVEKYFMIDIRGTTYIIQASILGPYKMGLAS